jgi:hypothetical protein
MTLPAGIFFFSTGFALCIVRPRVPLNQSRNQLIFMQFSAPGSILLVDGISASAVERAKSSPSPVLRSWTWGSNDPEAYFNAHGWKVLSVDDVTGGMFGRVLPSWPGRESNLTWYMTARVQE